MYDNCKCCSFGRERGWNPHRVTTANLRVPASVLDKNTRLIDVHTSDFGKYCMNVVGVNFAALCIELVNAAFNSEN